MDKLSLDTLANDITLGRIIASNPNCLHHVEKDRKEPMKLNETDNHQFYDTKIDIKDISFSL